MLAPVKRTLRDGGILEIFRFEFPSDCGNVPDWLPPLFQQELPEYWHSYYQEIFRKPVDDVISYCIAGIVDGVPCCRMWFAFSGKTGSGNFGNVLTLPQFRRRGIMKELLELLAADFARSGALFCSCDAASAAAPAYEKAGFTRIFPPGEPPMVLMRPGVGNFSELLEKAYGDTSGAIIRPGVFADRFDCDKLLMYAPEIYGKVSMPPEVSSYLSLWYEHAAPGKCTVKVLESRSGFCAGFAFSMTNGRSGIILHPRFSRYEETLFKETAL